MRLSQMSKISSLAYFILFAFSIFTIIFVGFDSNAPSYYRVIWILPLVFSAVMLFVAGTGDLFTSSITGIITIILYFVRMVLTPFVMRLGKYATIINASVFEDEIYLAIIEMCAETIFLFLTLYIMLSRKRKLQGKTDEQSSDEELMLENNKPRFALWLVVLAMVLYGIILIIHDPTLIRANFLILIDMNDTYYAYSSSASGLGTLSMFVEIMNSFFKLVQVLLPPMLIISVSRKISSRRLKYLITFLVFLAVIMVSTEDRIDAVFAGIAFLFMVRDLFGAKFKNRFTQWLIIIVAVGILGLAIKSGAVSGSSGVDFGKASEMLNAYFSGIPTVASGIRFSNELGIINIYRILPDSVSKIPYFTYVLNMLTGISIRNSNQLFNDFLETFMGYNYGQILPSTALGYEYFSTLFAPFLPIIFTGLSVYFEGKIKKQKDAVRRNLYYWITICVAASSIISSNLLVTAKIAWFAIAMIMVCILDKNKIKEVKESEMIWLQTH